jgi:hypothetical protein
VMLQLIVLLFGSALPRYLWTISPTVAGFTIAFTLLEAPSYAFFTLAAMYLRLPMGSARTMYVLVTTMCVCTRQPIGTFFYLILDLTLVAHPRSVSSRTTPPHTTTVPAYNLPLPPGAWLLLSVGSLRHAWSNKAMTNVLSTYVHGSKFLLNTPQNLRTLSPPQLVPSPGSFRQSCFLFLTWNDVPRRIY